MKPKKSLGQNFLKSPAVIRKMVEVAELTAADTVLEIGPGKGALTQHLLKSGARVNAVEKDVDMIPILEERFLTQINNGQLILQQDDVTNLEIRNILNTAPQESNEQRTSYTNMYGESDYEVTDKEMCKKNMNYKLIANIPYYITGEILRRFLESDYQPSSMTLMVQKEVAQRIVARNNKGSILSMSVKAYGEPKYVQKVPAMLFNPKPKVDSAILHIANISKEFFKENNITEEQFFKVLKHGFAQKRKKLTKNLHNQAVTQDSQQDIVNILTKLKIDSNVRAENLTLENWGKLSMYLHN